MGTTALDRSQTGDGAVVVTWAGCAAGDTGAVYTPRRQEALAANVQFSGTFGGTIVLQGSNDNTNWVTLTDQSGVAISTSAAAAFEFSCSMAYIRPLPGSGVSDVDVAMCLRGERQTN
jgi:hypothetical protein